MKQQFGLALLLLAPPVHAASWGKDRLWNDGRAEVAVYDAEIPWNGKPRTFREQLTTRQENLGKDRVLKFSQIQNFEAENYARSFVTSVYVTEADVQRVVKITAGMQDWMGTLTKVYTGSGDGTGGTLAINPPTAGTIDPVEVKLEKEDYFEDQLPITLRALPFKEGFQKKIRVWDLMTSTGMPMPGMAEATLSVDKLELVRCRAGSINCWVVTVKKPAGVDTYWFEKAEPNILVKMETHDGRKRVLHGRARWSYWDHRLPMPNILK